MIPTFGALAVDGGEPVRRDLLPYAHQAIDEEDFASVIEVLRSQWLTTGPVVDAFEREFATAVGAGYALTMSSGTAALHSAVSVLGIGPSDEVILPAMTFVATANCVVYRGAVRSLATLLAELHCRGTSLSAVAHLSFLRRWQTIRTLRIFNSRSLFCGFVGVGLIHPEPGI